MRYRFVKKTAAVMSALIILSLGGCGKTGEQQHQSGMPSVPGMTTTQQASVSPTTEATTEESVTPPAKERVYADQENEEFEKYLMEAFQEAVTEDSMTYNYYVKDGAAYGVEAPEIATLGDCDNSEEAMERRRKEFQEEYEELLKFEDASLTKEEAFIYDWIKDNADNSKTCMDKKYDYFYDPFNPNRGIQGNLPSNFTSYRFDDKKDVEDYIALLGDVGVAFDSYMDYEKRKADAGHSMSDANLDEVIGQCDAFIGDNPKDNYMITVFNTRIDEECTFLTAEEKEDFKKRNEDVIVNVVIPTFQKLKEFLTSIKGTCKTSGALCEYDGGDVYYAMLAKSSASTNKTPAEIAAYLDEKLQALFAEMYALYMENSEYYQAFIDDYETLFKETDAMDIEELIELIRSTAMEDYPELKELKYTAHHMSPAEQAAAGNTMAYYMRSPVDSRDSNVIYVNDAYADNRWMTLAHEGCPGHMYQYNYFQQTNPKPIRAMAYDLGYTEGWAVMSSYASYKALFSQTMDAAKADYYARMKELDDAIGYCLYGRADVGINYEGWSVQDCIDNLSPYGFNEAAADSIFNLVTGDPSYYLCYSESYCEMVDLREYARQELGDKFDITEYYDTILRVGPCKFHQLRRVVDDYIAEKQK